MSNFPAIQGGVADLAAAVQKSQIHLSDAGGFSHIKYDSYTGEWAFGKEHEDLTGEKVTIITDSIAHGWHLWVDREVTKRMVGFLESLPEPMESEVDRKGKTQDPNEARGFQCVLDDEDGVQMSWEHSTVGCRQAIDEVMNAIRSRAMTDPDFLYPVVVLTSSAPYENRHKDGEMIHPPKLEIVGWRNREGEDAPDEVAAVEDKSSEAEAAAGPEAAEETTTEETADAEPSRRRRRRAG